MPDPVAEVGREELLPGKIWLVFRNERTGQITKVPESIMSDPEVGPKYMMQMAGYPTNLPNTTPGQDEERSADVELGETRRKLDVASERWRDQVDTRNKLASGTRQWLEDLRRPLESAPSENMSHVTNVPREQSTMEKAFEFRNRMSPEARDDLMRPMEIPGQPGMYDVRGLPDELMKRTAPAPESVFRDSNPAGRIGQIAQPNVELDNASFAAGGLSDRELLNRLLGR